MHESLREVPLLSSIVVDRVQSVKALTSTAAALLNLKHESQMRTTIQKNKKERKKE
jgi:hypothetical protein